MRTVRAGARSGMGLARLFRVLRNAGSADLPHPLDPVATQGGYVAAVENHTASPGSPVGTRGAPEAGKQYRRQQTRSLVPREGKSLVCRAFECLLQIARLALIIRRTVGVTISNRRVRTRMHGGVAGVGG